MATVDANSSVTCQLPVSGIAITEAERVGRVELQWRNGTKTFVVESSNMKQLSECSRHNECCSCSCSDVSSVSVCNGMSIALNLRNCVMSCCAVITCSSLFGIQYVRLIT